MDNNKTQKSSRKDIHSLSPEDLKSFFAGIGEKPFRAKQAYEWIWQKAVSSFDEMTNLSNTVREALAHNFFFSQVIIDKSVKSSDGTEKFALKLFDSEIIEGVLIPSDDRVTACISTQVGCALGCKFCATGKMKFKRDLSAGEIFRQVAVLRQKAIDDYGKPLSNIVIMGMGEPLMNFGNTLQAIDMITSPEGLGFSPRRITLSTVGIPEMIMKLGDMKVRFNLAISLHFADDFLRNEYIPVNKKYNLESLIPAIKYFYSMTKSRVTIEYLLLKDINDNLRDAKLLAAFCRNFPVKINLIEYNSVEHLLFEPSTKEKMTFFSNFLEGKNIVVNIRRSKGKDIAAACGQLKAEGYK